VAAISTNVITMAAAPFPEEIHAICSAHSSRTQSLRFSSIGEVENGSAIQLQLFAPRPASHVQFDPSRRGASLRDMLIGAFPVSLHHVLPFLDGVYDECPYCLGQSDCSAVLILIYYLHQLLTHLLSFPLVVPRIQEIVSATAAKQEGGGRRGCNRHFEEIGLVSCPLLPHMLVPWPTFSSSLANAISTGEWAG
jgi:hypothetical protein